MVSILSALFLLAAPTAPLDLPRVSVQVPVPYEVCAVTPLGVSVGVGAGVVCPEGADFAPVDVAVREAAENQGVKPELFAGATVLFVPAVITGCSKDLADDNDYAGCTDPTVKLSIVSLLYEHADLVLVHELEHTAIHLKAKTFWHHKQKREEAMHKALDAKLRKQSVV